MKRLKALGLSALLMLLTACHQVTLPTAFSESASQPDIYPDYRDVTVPVNIAPLTFEMNSQEVADNIVARFATDGQELLCEGIKIQPDADDWRELMEAAAGKSLTVDVYTQQGKQWVHHKPFSITVSADSIDPWISYRLISPSYVTYEELTINQRCLENYDERVVYDNMLCGTEKDGQCINCHNYQQYNPERMQFHARQYRGGTVVAYDGKVQKINMRNDSILSAGVYPTWHPRLKLIVYSTNKTSQTFHTRDLNKIEVFDAASDLIAYDVERNEVTNIENDTTEFEVFPCWAPDGRTLYYCSAHFEFRDTVSHEVETINRAKEVKYSIYKKAFDPDSRTFGQREMVFDAAAMDMSATLPRISPDGRYLMFTLGGWGCFHIWHRDADLWLMDLTTGDTRQMSEINSPNTESYHAWSSNGRWVVFSSRRDDGGYTRPFIAHIDASGRGAKPFELPCADPDYHRQFLKSYNIPEFMRGPVTITPQQFADVLKTDGNTVRYVNSLRSSKKE
ncbi:MAG: PD40 domain-containing protein [Prevotella sp.]|nr:PD40 domain-containing protein [Prevotella sp.]